jgi:putative ABC transport system permease protein
VVVGKVLAINDTGESYDQTAVVPPELLDAVRRGEGFRQAYVTVAPGADRQRVIADLGRTLEVDDLTDPPSPIAHLSQIRGLLVLLALLLGLLGAVALAHAVTAAERRRRRELGVLRAVGFTKGQSVRTLASMALVLSCLAALLGIPLGLLAANLAWRAMAEGVHVATDLDVPILAAATAVPVAAVLAVLAAALPGWRAARMDVAEVLRSE